MRKLATLGLALVALMQVSFLLTGFGRRFPYQEVQVLSIVGTLVAAYGLATGRNVALAVGLGINLVTRVLQPILGVTRLPLWATAILALGWAWGAAQAARGRSPAAGFWVLGVGHALAMLLTFSRLASSVALGLGAVGFFLAAPHVRR